MCVQSTDVGLALAGRYFTHTGNVSKARQCIERVVTKCRASVVLLAALGWAYALSGVNKYTAKAASVFKKALKLCGSAKRADVSALLGRAFCAERERKFEEALTAIKQIATIYPYLPLCSAAAPLYIACLIRSCVVMRCASSFGAAYAERVRLSFCSGNWSEALHAASRLPKRDADSIEAVQLTALHALCIARPASPGATPDRLSVPALQALTQHVTRTEPLSAALALECAVVMARCARRNAG